MGFFAAAVTHVLAGEGGFSQNPHDHGGATNHGITLRELALYRGQATVADVQTLSVAEAQAIYRAFYWDMLGLEDCTNRVAAVAIFDQAVNRGLYPAVTNAQGALNALGGAVRIDGRLGPVTLAALNQIDAKAFQLAFFKKAQMAYVSIVAHDPTQLGFLAGWVARTHTLLDL